MWFIILGVVCVSSLFPVSHFFLLYPFNHSLSPPVSFSALFPASPSHTFSVSRHSICNPQSGAAIQMPGLELIHILGLA